MALDGLQGSYENWKGEVGAEDFNKVILFFVSFVRFEYALKQAKYLKHENSKNAEPKWDADNVPGSV